jgi:hypothetical protein
VTLEEFLNVNSELIERVKEVCLQGYNAGGVQVFSVEILGKLRNPLLHCLPPLQ